MGEKQRGETKEAKCVIYIKKKRYYYLQQKAIIQKEHYGFFFLKESTASLVQHLCPFFQIIRMESNSRERLEGWTVTQKRATDSHDVRLLSSLQEGATHVTKQMPASPLFQSERLEWKVSYLDSRNTSQICMS